MHMLRFITLKAIAGKPNRQIKKNHRRVDRSAQTLSMARKGSASAEERGKLLGACGGVKASRPPISSVVVAERTRESPTTRVAMWSCR